MANLKEGSEAPVLRLCLSQRLRCVLEASVFDLKSVLQLQQTGG